MRVFKSLPKKMGDFQGIARTCLFESVSEEISKLLLFWTTKGKIVVGCVLFIIVSV